MDFYHTRYFVQACFKGILLIERLFTPSFGAVEWIKLISSMATHESEAHENWMRMLLIKLTDDMKSLDLWYR